MQKKIRFLRLLQRGIKCCQQRLWQMFQETDRIAQQKRCMTFDLDQPHIRIQRGKQQILFQYLFFLRLLTEHQQMIQNGGFPGVGVADQGDLFQGALLAEAPLRLFLFLDSGQFSF